jgi:putative phosphoribosyl transferase
MAENRGEGSEAGVDEGVRIRLGRVSVEGHLLVPAGAPGTVIFAHGSGSSRHSPRNRHVAEVLNGSGLGTFLFDLLTPDEDLDRANVFDIGLLSERLLAVTGWLRSDRGLSRQSIGYFGASTGAAAALSAAAELKEGISAVVSRGGRPDLAGSLLEDVTAPTLLIVGGLDTQVLELNRSAQARLRCESQLEVIGGASHLFEEPGALDRVADLARSWLRTHLAAKPEE